jgi:hypothetical protein
MRLSFIPVSVLLFTLLSCQTSTNKNIPPNSSGRINNLNVVIENQIWQDTLGETIRSIFAANAKGLPQQEPMYSLSQLPPKVFNGFVRKNRNVIMIEKAPQADFKWVKDTFARPQNVLLFKGPNYQSIAEIIKKNKEKALSIINKTEIKEKQRRINKSPKKTTTLEEKLGISLLFPTAYRYAKEDDNFIWMRKDIQNGSMELLAYQVPLSALNEKQNTISDIIKIRDSIGKKYVPGPTEGSYLATDDAYAPYLFETKVGDKFAYEVKGVWDVEGSFMAGPFQMLIIKDKARNRYLIVEGFVFKPSSAKRNNMFEIESILRSVEFVD